ncbi:MAG TPA: LLM class flavin-dependent oxidoreductase [Acidimicrobiia bacterium]|nr:LLM class flavin-dependent oxidoreductase [Acidimicrobiia bacterium]
MGDVRLGIVSVKTLDERTRDTITAAAAAGLDHVGSIDHVCFRGGEGIDGLITAAALAGIHPDIGLYVGVYQLPLRHPVLVARQLSTLAHFAPGRLTFGVGIAGEDPHEFENCGVDMRTRGRRTDESLALLRRLLTGESVTFDGEFFQLRDTRILPAPQPPIPVIIGGRSDASMRRAGAFGDGWIGAFNSARRFSEAVTIVAEHADRVRRGSVGWQHAMEVWCGFDTTAEAARDRLADAMQRFYGLPYESFERYCPAGRPEHVSEHLAPFLEAGCQNFNLIPIAGSVDEAIEGAVQVKQSLVGSSA